MLFAVVGIGTVTKDYLVSASPWKIALPRMEKSAVNKEHVSTFPHECRKTLLVPGRPFTVHSPGIVFWSVEEDLLHSPMPEKSSGP
jgi:hypothetical protein